MNNVTRRMLMDRRMRDRGYRRGMDYGMGNYEANIRGDYESDYARRGGDYDDYETDGRRGVKGTGRYGIGGSMYRGRRDRSMGDYADYADYDDYGDHEKMRLSKRDMTEWKRGLENADGTSGEHFMLEQIRNAAGSMNIPLHGDMYDEKDLCLAANMLYSDYCDSLRAFIPKDKEAMVYTRMARDFLEDDDASVRGKEKLAVYYYCIVSDE